MHSNPKVLSLYFIIYYYYYYHHYCYDNFIIFPKAVKGGVFYRLLRETPSRVNGLMMLPNKGKKNLSKSHVRKCCFSRENVI